MNDKKRIALETIDEACERFGCTKVVALFSGGDDSLAALRVAVEHPHFMAAGPSPLVEEVLGSLEEAGMPEELCDAVVKLIEGWEATRVEPEPFPEPDHDPPPEYGDDVPL